MLQQILRDMYVDPEILAELDEEQKQTLFCKMREEQVRRWKSWTEKLGEESKRKPDGKRKKVDFLKGIDGEPWVWVMGEHENDKSIEEILKEEAIEKARKIAEKEAEGLRKQVEAELSEYLRPKIEEMEAPQKIEDDMDIYCSVDELRDKINNKNTNNLNNYSINHYQNKNKFSVIDARDVLQDLSLNSQKVAQRVALWEKRLTETRTCEIFQKIQKKHQEVAREAEEAEKKQEQFWKEQERKAKEAEQQIREIARRAREEHRLTNFEIETPYSTVNSGVPPGRQAVVEWYRNAEKPKCTALDQSNNIEPWFHGLITRAEAEKMLLDQPYGSYLVRLSEKIWGYAISHRAKEKCKHYLVNASGQTYQFLGNNQINHNSLGDLVDYHRRNPLTGGDTLMYPCPRNDNSEAAIRELYD